MAEPAAPPAAEGQKRVLFMTSSEYGECNVILAVIYELLLRQNCEIHVASFAPLEKRIRELNTKAAGAQSSQATFHTIAGLSPEELYQQKEGYFGPFPPGVRGCIDTYKVTLPMIATAWDGAGYMVGYKSCLEIVHDVQPDLLVCGSLMNQAQDACRTLKRRYVVLSPNTFREILGKQQPFFERLLTYPALASGYPFPLPWHMVPINSYLKIRGIIILLTNPKLKELLAFRKSRNLPSLPPAFDIWKEENHYILPVTAATDFPCDVKSNVSACGPLLLPFESVGDGDAKLQAWLGQAPTVLINLGSMIKMDDSMVREFSAALKVLLDSQPKLQVLWKIKKSGGISLQSAKQYAEKAKAGKDDDADKVTEASLEAISDEIASGRVKVEEWLSVDPLAVLRSGHVVCAVHHGGSNSFHEALSAGIPQVVLPCWLDTFDFAARAEYLGIGVYGSRTAAPRVERKELTTALMRVLGDSEEASEMRSKAKELGEVANAAGGRVKAADKIDELLEAWA